MTNEADGAQQRDADIETKLSGLDRLRLAGVVSEERYQAMRQRLLTGAGSPGPADSHTPPATAPQPSPPSPPPAWKPAPADIPRSTASRNTIVAVVAAGVLLFAGAGAAAIAFSGHSATPTTPAAAHTANTPTPAPSTPTPTQNLAAFGQQYLADISPLNKAWAAYDDAIANAPAGAACGCPPGYFSIRTVIPSFDALLTMYTTTIGNLQVMQQELTGQAAADCGRLVQDMQVTRTALQSLFSSGTQSAQIAAADRANAAWDIELKAALVLRADLGLPPPTPAA